MNYPEPRPVKRMPMAHIVTVTGKHHISRIQSKTNLDVNKSMKPSWLITLGSNDLFAISASNSHWKVCEFWLFYVYQLGNCLLLSPLSARGKQSFGSIWVSQLNLGEQSKQVKAGNRWNLVWELSPDWIELDHQPLGTHLKAIGISINF